MKSKFFTKALFIFTFFLMISTQSWAQAPENGSTMSQTTAEKYLQGNWDDRSKLKYFSVDKAANDNISNAFNGAGVTHVRMERGKVDDIEYLFTIGVDTEGNLVGDYYLSKMPTDLPIGPCPKNCD